MFRQLWTMTIVAWLLLLAPAASVPAEKMSVEDAWRALPHYQYGQDMAPLLIIDRAVIESMADPKTRAACAARLASLLEADGTTSAAQQYICLTLRQVGTPAQVPVLSRLLVNRETSQWARYALESIPGPESLAALRDALTKLKGDLLVGVINSVAARTDRQSVPILKKLADSKDRQVARAALWALGNIADETAVAFLNARAEKAGATTPPELAVPLVRCAHALIEAGKPEQARPILQRLSQSGQAVGVRRAALEGLVRLEGDKAREMLLKWFVDADPERRRIARGHLHALSDQQLDTLLRRLPELPDAGKLAVIEAAMQRRGKDVLPWVMTLAQSEKPSLKLAGIRALGLVGDASAIPFLMEVLAAGGEPARAAQESLARLPRKPVVTALLDAVEHKPDARISAIEVLKKIRCYEAIDPLIVLAAQKDPAVYGPALDGLRGIADPDRHDIPRLLTLVPKAAPGRHRDEVEKTIQIVCEKLPPGKDRAGPVLEALKASKTTVPPVYLSLLGRLGGPKALAIVDAASQSDDPARKKAAAVALCNWPTAEVADKLIALATSAEDAALRRRALRAYIRVVSRKSNRPEAETLAMLRRAFKLATVVEDKRLVLRRAAAVRTMESVEWLASFLDDPQLAPSACESIVELAHHRFLRQPNMDRFRPILEKVIQTSKNPDIIERAKRAKLGL